MILFATKNKFKKYHKSKNRFRGIDQRYILPKNGTFGLKFLGSVRLTVGQIEAIKKVVKKHISKKIKETLKVSIFPDLPMTKKSSGVRMGKGKGNIDFWCFPVNSGRVVFELSDKILKYNALSSLVAGSKKLSFRCRLVFNVKN